MAKKLADIELIIKGNEKAFFQFLAEKLDKETFTFIEGLSHNTNAYIFSGIIRNFFLKNYIIRDVDLVVESDLHIERLVPSERIHRNSFGGYKIDIGQFPIDLWRIDQTWAFKQQTAINYELEKYIPLTAFFNFSSIVYSLTTREFSYSRHFLQFLRDRTIDIVNTPNANYHLCVVNTLYYHDRYKLKISLKLFKLIKYLHQKGDKQYENVQIKHFKSILYSDQLIAERIQNSVFSIKKK